MSLRSLRLVVVLTACAAGLHAEETIEVQEKPGHLLITRAGVPIGEFWFDHPKILRPFFANLKAPDGILITRAFPPVEGIDATDHADMHPGLWLGFGDLSGEDFWRNKGRIRHDRFLKEPAWQADRLAFTTESTLLISEGREIATMENRFELIPGQGRLQIVWDAMLTPGVDGFSFGDQEEMGLGVRVATPLAETKGGLLTSSTGTTTAKATWGQPAAWCDYSGLIAGKRVGVMIVPATFNPHPSWWHNRDYGVFVSNPFGRKAMKQGEASRIEVKQGTTYRLKHSIILHESREAEAVDLETLAREAR